MTVLLPTAVKALLTETTLAIVRPRFEGSNICSWIGFKHVNYLVEEAVLEHFRRADLGAGELFEKYGLGLDLVGLDTRILHAFHIDDIGEAEVVPVVPDGSTEFAFRVTVRLRRSEEAVKAVSSKVKVVLRRDSYLSAPAEVPTDLARFVRDRLEPGPGTKVAAEPDLAAAVTDALARGTDAVLAALTEGRNAFAWKWRLGYPYCHFTERIQMSGYLRLMEEAKDLFVADRGISIKTLLDDRRWIPVVPRSTLQIIDEALMEEDLYTVYTVEEIYKDLTYTSRMDNYVIRDGRLVLTQTGTIVHGYALIENRSDWELVTFDQRVLVALRGDNP